METVTSRCRYKPDSTNVTHHVTRFQRYMTSSIPDQPTSHGQCNIRHMFILDSFLECVRKNIWIRVVISVTLFGEFGRWTTVRRKERVKEFQPYYQNHQILLIIFIRRTPRFVSNLVSDLGLTSLSHLSQLSFYNHPK